MDPSLDIYTLIFLVLAIVVIVRLRSVLGRRTGQERPPLDRVRRSESATNGAAPSQDNVITLPRNNDAEASVQTAARAAAADERIKLFLPPDSPAAQGLVDIARADPAFDPANFVRGAKAAYERIVIAFANGDVKALKSLLSKEVNEGFSSAISDREKRGEMVETDFVGIDRAEIVEAELKNKTAQVTVKFVSQLITAIRNRGGEVIDGDPKKVKEMTDIWTFARETSSRDPNWRLIATQAAN